MMPDIKANIDAVRHEIERTCKHVDTAINQPKLIAVSKVQPIEKVRAALEAGHRVFGENRVQEAEERWGELKPDYAGVELHLIGGLQTNKAANAVALFDVIHSVDRLKLAKALSGEMEKQGKHLPVYIQVNTGREEQKGGCVLEELPELLAGCKELGLEVVGLMCIPPAEEDPTMHFALLKKLAKRHGLQRLSMGMSGDYALAAAMGATDVRVGTAIFGARDYS